MVGITSLTSTMFEIKIEGIILIIAFTAIEIKMVLKYSNSCFSFPSHFVIQIEILKLQISKIYQMNNHYKEK
jgi:hypothetical protein